MKHMLKTFGLLFFIVGFSSNASVYAKEEPSAKSATATPSEQEWQKLNLRARDLFEEGKPFEAIAAGEAALAYAKKNLDDKSSSIPKSLNNLGVLHFTQRDYAKADSYYQEAITIAEKNLGPENLFISDILLNQARLAQINGKYGEATTGLDRALKIREKEYGPDNPQLLSVLIQLSQVDRMMGLNDEATEIENRIIKIRGQKKTA